jgi:hypothetical protein
MTIVIAKGYIAEREGVWQIQRDRIKATGRLLIGAGDQRSTEPAATGLQSLAVPVDGQVDIEVDWWSA